MSRRILVIDDDRAVRVAFDYALRDEGYQLRLAANAQDAALALSTDPPDLVFLDLRLPDEDGIGILERLRREHPDLPVYVVTAYLDQYLGRLREVRRSGISFEVAEKPLSEEHIRQIVRGVFAENRGEPLTYLLRLYLAGLQIGDGHIKDLVEQRLRGSGIAYRVEVIDVLEDPARATADNVFATPSLVRIAPGPPQRVVGDLSNIGAVLSLLGLPIYV